jgi:site-specific recombinase XerC
VHWTVRDARHKGKFIKRDSVTFDVLCQRWLDSRHDVREVTVMGYRSWLMAVREQLGPKRVQDLTRTDIEKVIKRLEQQNRSHSTIVHTLGAIRQVLAYGISSNLLSVNVAASVKPPRKQHSTARVDTEPKDEPWTQEELLRFRALADGHEWASAWRLTLCGLRRSEVMGLRWESVDLDSGEVKVEHGRVVLDGHRTATDDPKSSASRRTVPVEDMHRGTTALLRALRARQAQDRLRLGLGIPRPGWSS